MLGIVAICRRMYKKWHHFKEHPAQIFSSWGAMASKNVEIQRRSKKEMKYVLGLYRKGLEKTHNRQNQCSFRSHVILYSISLSMYIYIRISYLIHRHMLYRFMYMMQLIDGMLQYNMFDHEK